MVNKKLLILGSGGREHALASKLGEEIGIENIFIAPGNAGTANCGTNIDLGLNDFDGIAEFCLKNEIGMILPGSEAPICEGIKDFFESKTALQSIMVFAPSKEASKLEASKDFAKQFMIKHGIATAAYQTFDKQTVAEGKKFLQTLQPPYVLKADGLAAGKGVLILHTLGEAQVALEEMLLENKFGAASNKVVIEEFLDGIEFSIFVVTNGKEYVLLPEAKDYKRIGEGDTGLNTGGMGAVSPLDFFTNELRDKTIETIVKPTIEGLSKDKLKYLGFIFFGLINVNGTPKVIEYNIRMGDPETEVVIPRLNESLWEILQTLAQGAATTRAAAVIPDTVVTIMNVAQGYPESYNKGDKITIVKENMLLYHAGTKQLPDNTIVTNGGRVLAVGAKGDNLSQALERAYSYCKEIHFFGKTYRTDIGKDLLSLK